MVPTHSRPSRSRRSSSVLCSLILATRVIFQISSQYSALAFAPASSTTLPSSKRIQQLEATPRGRIIDWRQFASSEQSERISTQIHPPKQKGPRGKVTSQKSIACTIAKKKSKRKSSKGYRKPGFPKSSSNKPWKADFHTSLRTQGRIKQAAFDKSTTGTKKAKFVLKALWSSRPENCNAANIIATLTYSAKASSSQHSEYNTNSSKDNSENKKEVETLVFSTIRVLHDLLVEDPFALTPRQLANAAWSIAKHYDRSSALLPPPAQAIALSSDEQLGSAETWDIESEDSNLLKNQKIVHATIDLIAERLSSSLIEQQHFEESRRASDDTVSSRDEDHTQRNPDAASKKSSRRNPRKIVPAKLGELCMAAWAFGLLRPRDRPPGWQYPPQIGQLPVGQNAQRSKNSTGMIKFEQWGSFSGGNSDGRGNDSEDEVRDIALLSVTDQLFDAIGCALSQPATQTGMAHDERTISNLINEGSEDRSGPHSTRLRLDACTWSELANLAWSYASHGLCKTIHSERLLLGISREAARRLRSNERHGQQMLTRDIAQLIWALGTLQADNFRLADDLVYLVGALTNSLRLKQSNGGSTFGRSRPLRRWSCPDLVQVALSLSHARIDELPLLGAIYEESTHRLTEGFHDQKKRQKDGSSVERRSFQSWEVSILLWSQARLYLKSSQGQEFEDFVEDAVRCIMNRLQSSGRSSTLENIGIGSQEQANIAWSLTVLEKYNSPESVELLNRIFLESCRACKKERTVQLEHAHQLWQAYFLLEDESPQAVANVPPWFVDYLREKWRIEKARGKQSSARHRSLSQTLSFMGVSHYNEHDEDIDVAIVLKDGATWTHETESNHEATRSGQVNGVAVEFDGPNHFTREKEQQPGSRKPESPRALGHTVLKYRLLKRQGWNVVRVPYYEFDRIPFWASMVSLSV